MRHVRVLVLASLIAGLVGVFALPTAAAPPSGTEGTLEFVIPVPSTECPTGDPCGTPGPLSGVTYEYLSAVAIDAADNMYFSDFNYSTNYGARIRVADGATQETALFAGNGGNGSSGNDGPAVDASFEQVAAMTTDATGNVFFTDGNAGTIRRVDAASGIVTVAIGGGATVPTIAGVPFADADLTPSDIAFDRFGDLIIISYNESRVFKADFDTELVTLIGGTGSTGFNGDDIPATSANIDQPNGLAVMFNGDVLVTSRGQNRLRKIDIATGLITTVAGDGSISSTGDGGPAADATFEEPGALAVDSVDNVFIADRVAQNVRRIDATSGIITNVIGNGNCGTAGEGGPAVDAEICGPINLDIDSLGNLYLVDQTPSLRVAYGVAEGHVGGFGYRLVASDGGVFGFGDGEYLGGTGGEKLNQPIVAAANTATGDGYWLVASDGGIFSFGDAVFHGSTGALTLNKPIVGAASTPSGNGYWLVASDGGIFNFGDAEFFGSTGALTLNKPIVGMIPTPNGFGYWLVASDGGIFSFGDAEFFGSTGALTLNQPIVGGSPSPTGDGYWFVASDGGIFSFGDAEFFGSTGALTLNKPIVSMFAAPLGAGYTLVASDGGIFTFGDAQYLGSTGALTLNKPIVTALPR